MFNGLRQEGECLVEGLYLYAPSTGGVGLMPYLPMTVISYLPATLLNTDLRWMTILLRGLGAWVIYKHGTKNTKTLMPWIWMHPYINFRHELYIEPFLFFLTMMSLSRGWLASVV
ncbi:MAG: hypothetical protein KA715_08710 [Xanthomonadaceae bacterium]|nr:hypothetical protein [Xanthomonadaceae bacterium]